MPLRVALLAALAALATALAPSSAALAQSSPYCPSGQASEYRFGFAILGAHLGPTMGEPTTCEYGDPLGTGDTLQRTTAGVAFYRQDTNTPIFTDGWQRWAWTQAGLVSWEGAGIDPPGARPAETQVPPDVPLQRPLPPEHIPPGPGADTPPDQAQDPRPWRQTYSFGNGTVRIIQGLRSGVRVMDVELINELVRAVRHRDSRIRSYTFFFADHVEFGPSPDRRGPEVDWRSAADTYAITSRMVPGSVRESVFELPGQAGVHHAHVVGVTPERDAYGIFTFDQPGAIRSPLAILGYGWTTRLIRFGTAALRDETVDLGAEPWLASYQRYRIENDESFRLVTR